MRAPLPPAARGPRRPRAARERGLWVPPRTSFTASLQSSPCLSSSSSPPPPSTPLPRHSPGSTLGCDRFCRVWAHVSSARLCSPLRRSGGFWRPWVDARGKQEEEDPHHAEEVVSEPRAAGRASEGRRWFSRAGNAGPRETCARPAPRLRSRLLVVLPVAVLVLMRREPLRHGDRAKSEAAESPGVTFPEGARNAWPREFPDSRKR